jgi:hypothetical protein
VKGPTRSKNTKAGPRFRCWLQQLDLEAKKLPRAQSWLEFPVFMFARYPLLQPKRLKTGDRKRRSLIETGFNTFNKVVGNWEKRISEHSEACRAIRGLTSGQRKQLAALVFDIECEFEEFADSKETRSKIRPLSSEAKRRQRTIQRKIEKTKAALEDLQKYAYDLHHFHGLSNIGDIASQCLERLKTPIPKRTFELSGEVGNSPVTFAMLKLYCFFREECRQTGDESEVRVALIRNEFWVEERYAKRVLVRHEYNGEQSQGCDTVHTAVGRYY